MEFFENLLQIVFYTLWIMIVISFFVIVVRIIMDVFRDRDLGGFGKAAWLVLIVLVPILGSILYLLARGAGMARREAQAALAVRDAQVEYAKGLMDEAGGAAGQIRAAKDLLDSGAISAEEYSTLKAKALA